MPTDLYGLDLPGSTHSLCLSQVCLSLISCVSPSYETTSRAQSQQGKIKLAGSEKKKNHVFKEKNCQETIKKIHHQYKLKQTNALNFTSDLCNSPKHISSLSECVARFSSKDQVTKEMHHHQERELQYLLFNGLILLIVRGKVKENSPLTHAVES